MHLLKASEHQPALMHKFFTFICNKRHKLEVLPLRRSRSGFHQCWLLLAVFGCWSCRWEGSRVGEGRAGGVWVVVWPGGAASRVEWMGLNLMWALPQAPKHKNAHLELLRIWGEAEGCWKMSCVVLTAAVWGSTLWERGGRDFRQWGQGFGRTASALGRMDFILWKITHRGTTPEWFSAKLCQ